MTWTDRLAPPPQPDPAAREAEKQRLIATWKNREGIARLTEVNNTTVGLWYTAASIFFFAFAGVLALMIRAQLAVPDNDLMTAHFYNQLFTLHGPR